MMTATKPKAAEATIRNLMDAGYEPGAPERVTADMQAVDRDTSAEMVCPGCHRTGMTPRPFRRGPVYVVIAECGTCGAGEVM